MFLRQFMLFWDTFKKLSCSWETAVSFAAARQLHIPLTATTGINATTSRQLASSLAQFLMCCSTVRVLWQFSAIPSVFLLRTADITYATNPNFVVLLVGHFVPSISFDWRGRLWGYCNRLIASSRALGTWHLALESCTFLFRFTLNFMETLWSDSASSICETFDT